MLLLSLAGCIGGQSGTPTPLTPDPGCAETGRTPVEEVTPAIDVLAGTWVGDCDTQDVRLAVPSLEVRSGESIHYEWNAYGAEDATPVDCRTGYDVRFAASLSLGGDDATFEMAALHGQYLPTFGEPAELDRYGSARTEFYGTLEAEAGATLAFPHPPEAEGFDVTSVQGYGVISDDGSQLVGRLEWFGTDPDAEPPVVIPDDGSPDGTDPWNPGANPAAAEPASLVASCEFTLRRE